MTRDFTVNFLRRIVATIPSKGLPFSELEWLDAQMRWPQQPPGWLSHLRAALQICVEQKLLRFHKGRYYRANSIYLMPLPPLKLLGDALDPLWPEQAKRLQQ